MIDNTAPERDDAYDPSTVEVDRGRMQGLGVGARDLARQRDPADGAQGALPASGAQDGAGTDAAPQERIQAGPPGAPDPAYDARDSDEVSFSQPAGGAGGR